MGKIYAPLGYTIKYKGHDYYDTSSKGDLIAGVMGLADWDLTTQEKITSSSNKELIKILTDNGFELEEK